MIDTYRIYATDKIYAKLERDYELYDLIYIKPNDVDAELFSIHQDLIDYYFRYSDKYVKFVLISHHAVGDSKFITEIKSFD